MLDFAVLKAPNLPDPLAVIRVLVRAADFNERARTLVADDALRDSLGADPVTRQMALIRFQAFVETATRPGNAA